MRFGDKKRRPNLRVLYTVAATRPAEHEHPPECNTAGCPHFGALHVRECRVPGYPANFFTCVECFTAFLRDVRVARDREVPQ